ncbi:unnamed protein product [Ostreobium quekettii]|uniref:DOMON domain-containing protein n=1 Tax=Ostreobium quekettii TaxID=121088 RepID=A0A8S1J582_9CHLO|nr:unnamed protein product [Ostreobium quekettii]
MYSPQAMFHHYKRAMAASARAALLLGSLLALLSLEAAAMCPYHMLWMEGSPMKLPDEQIAQHSTARGVQFHRTLLQNGAPENRQADGKVEGVEFPIGGGSCAYTNPMTQGRSCIQFTGELWANAPGRAEKRCTVEGPSPGATDGEYAAEALCEAFSDADFAGVCVLDAGEAEEVRTTFLSRVGEPASSCEQLKAVCETFVGGIFDGQGGKCGAGPAADTDRGPVNTSAPCQLSPGIAGGGHMHIDSHWDSTCENQENEYAQPLRWAADIETVLIQKGSRTVGRIYYDIANNRKRQDWLHVEGNEASLLFGIKNATAVHVHGELSIMDWDKGVCIKTKVPVGNLRSNWVLDSYGAGTVSQYLGPGYILYNGAFRHVRQWRKTEPLENAFMVQSYDEEQEWETPEGMKRRPLLRETPGSPGQGDAIDIFYNHTTEFEDSVFDILDGLDCRAMEGGGGGGFGELNTNSTFHIDSSFVRVDCDDCGLVYSDKEAEDNVADAKAPKGNATYLNGTEVIRQEGLLELTWEYFPDSDTFSFNFKSEVTGSWLALAFPKFSCAMVPADAVVAVPGDDGSEDDISPYKMEVAALSGVVLDNGQVLEDATLTKADGMQELSFSRKADNGGESVLNPLAPIDLTWAIGSDMALGYHGADGRGCLTINGVES